MVVIAEAKMNAQVGLRKIAAAAHHFAGLNEIPCYRFDACVQGQAVAPGQLAAPRPGFPEEFRSQQNMLLLAVQNSKRYRVFAQTLQPRPPKETLVRGQFWAAMLITVCPVTLV